ncbi:MAG: hypothetical protein CL566_11450 [Alphaproteobacteria bacterium]|nr:hypothetical protein [Alphaproteobacteria bacterium]
MQYRLDDPIGPGDRAPDFILPAASGEGPGVNLYTRVRGGVPLIVFYPDAEAYRAEVDALTAMADELSDDSVNPFLLVDSAAGEALPEPGEPFHVLRDTGGKTASEFGLSLESGPLTLRFDANLRLTGLRRDGQVAVRHFIDAVAAAPAPEGRLVQQLAPILIVPHVFTPDFCAELIEVHNSQGNTPSTVTFNRDGVDVQEVVPIHKVRYDHIVRDADLNRRIDDAFAKRVNIEIAKAFQFNVGAREPVNIARYPGDEDGHFSVHRDNVTPTSRHMRFAVTVNLNTDEYEGGALRFPEYGPDMYAPPTGGAVVFSCSHLHEAMPVRNGTRYALLAFLFSADDARAAREAVKAQRT